MTNALRHLDEELSALERAGLLRSDSAQPRKADCVVLCSNDYLGYASEPWDEGSLAPGGAGASRLIAGEDPAHLAAESALARWVGMESALLFSSGYAANVGALAALAGPGDAVVSDALNHASIIDGCRLSRAAVQVVPHLDLDAFEDALRRLSGARRRWVVTESYFSMEGDTADLASLRTICDAHDAALVVDEAHALGVFGPSGAGLCAASSARPDVLVGTLGKAVGLQGAFVAGSASLRKWLWNRARSFVFSTGVSPRLAAATVARVERVAADEGRRARLAAVCHRMRAALGAAGVPMDGSIGPIMPWRVGSPERAVAFSRSLRARGVVVQPIRPPTVPVGTSRLRIAASASLTDTEVAGGIEALRAVVCAQRE